MCRRAATTMLTACMYWIVAGRQDGSGYETRERAVNRSADRGQRGATRHRLHAHRLVGVQRWDGGLGRQLRKRWRRSVECVAGGVAGIVASGRRRGSDRRWPPRPWMAHSWHRAVGRPRIRGGAGLFTGCRLIAGACQAEDSHHSPRRPPRQSSRPRPRPRPSRRARADERAARPRRHHVGGGHSDCDSSRQRGKRRRLGKPAPLTGAATAFRSLDRPPSAHGGASTALAAGVQDSFADSDARTARFEDDLDDLLGALPFRLPSEAEWEYAAPGRDDHSDFPRGRKAGRGIDQQFLRGRSDSSPHTKSLTRRRGSTRANRPAIRPIRTSNASCQQAGSTLWPTATA
ncbi:hypothetical protein SMA5143A_7793 [Streptomyces sp. MA5143a]|nr:hypothetical protein SMA5143A_7793 [Streptomyces sp. MA5143a]